MSHAAMAWSEVCCGIGVTGRASAVQEESGHSCRSEWWDETTAAPPWATVERPADAGCAPVPAMADGKAGAVAGTIDIEMGRARVRVSGVVDVAALQQVLSHLGRKS